MAVATEGLAPERGAVPAVALGALVEGRLAARLAGAFGEEVQVSVDPGWSGFRLRALVARPAEVAPLVEAVRQAMLTPVGPGEPALTLVQRKVEALSRRPLPDRAMAFVARCTGEAYGLGADTQPTAAELEGWRQAAHGTVRVTFAVAGDDGFASALIDSLARAPAWPRGLARAPEPFSQGDAPLVTYDASSEIPPGGARVVLVARTAAPERAVEPAATLGDVRGPLASRLSALQAPALVRAVVATAHGDGGCVAVTLDLSARDLERDAPARIATAAALARQELTVELSDATYGPGAGGERARQAADPRDAAEQAAWWALAGRSEVSGDALQVSMAVGLSSSRDGGTSSAPPPPELRSELDRATIAWHARVVEGRAHVEPGQGETWILLASPCGTLSEAADAGSGAAVALAAAWAAGAVTSDAQLEPFVAADGIGVLAHGPARTGESSQAHGRRLADLAARAFAADTLDREWTTRARTALLVRASQTEALLLGTAGGALTSGHPSWVTAPGTNLGMSSISDDDIAQRAAALRAGPLRVAVLASSDASQADAAVRAVDRWIARRPGEVRACPLPASTRPQPGTYAVALQAGARSEALLALPLPAHDDAARASAISLAAALDGADGLLARALGAAPGEGERPLASAWSASVVGAPQAPALAVRLVSDDDALDAAVAQTRALLDRLRQGALREDDRARATRAIARARLAASLDPRLRTIALWRSEPPSAAEDGRLDAPTPTLDTLKAFAAGALRDDALVIVAARPPHSEPRATKAHDGRARAH